MELNIFSYKNKKQTVFALRPHIFTLITCGAAFCFLPAGNGHAQDAESAQSQLSSQAVQSQIPQTFPDQEATTSEASSQAPAQDAKPVADDTSSVNPIDQLSKEDESKNAPAEPEQKKLVPATPMGAAAQTADNGQAAPAQEPTAPEAQTNQESAAADNSAPPETTDILEKYAQKANAANAQRTGDSSQDALPPSAMQGTSVPGMDLNSTNNSVSSGGLDDSEQEEKTPQQLQEEIRTEAFDAAITGMFPLTPDQIKGLLKRYDETQKVTQAPVNGLPKPEISVQNLSLDPGVAPATIKTALGNVTTINILDATGAPWPVQDVTWAGDYEVVEPEQGGHIIRITPMTEFARGNIVIRLLTLKTPLTLTLQTSQDVVQYRVDARIPEYGPFAAAPIMQGGKSLVAGSPDLTSILDGVMPSGAIRLQVSGVDGRTTAYELGGTTFVRTPLTLLSPAWQSSVSSADGMNVYALSNAPVLLLSDSGEFQRATLSEKKDLLDE